MTNTEPAKTGTPKIIPCKRVAATLAYLMARTGLTPAAVASSIGSTTAYVERVRDERRSLDPKHREPMARLFQVTPDLLDPAASSGAVLHGLMEATNTGRAAVAEAMGTSGPFVSHVRTGRRGFPSNHRDSVATALGVPVDAVQTDGPDAAAEAA